MSVSLQPHVFLMHSLAHLKHVDCLGAYRKLFEKKYVGISHSQTRARFFGRLAQTSQRMWLRFSSVTASLLSCLFTLGLWLFPRPDGEKWECFPFPVGFSPDSDLSHVSKPATADDPQLHPAIHQCHYHLIMNC